MSAFARVTAPSVAAFLIVAATLLAGAASAQSNERLLSQINELDRELQDIRARAEEAGGGGSFSRNVTLRLSKLEEAVRGLTEAVENIRFLEQERANDTVARLEALEIRLEDLDGRPTERRGADDAAGADAEPAPEIRQQNAPADAAPQPAEERDAAAPETGASETAALGEQDGSAPEEGALGVIVEERPAASEAGPVDEAAIAAFAAAVATLETEGLDPGAAAVDAFLSDHGESPLAAVAQHKLGRAMLDAGRSREAARRFLSGYRDHAGAPVDADNLLGLGEALAQLGRIDDACAAFAEAPLRFPDSAAAAEEVARRVGCL